MTDLMSFLRHPFWEEWEEKFTENHSEYITPENSSVKKAAGDVAVSDCCGSNDPVTWVWRYIYNEIEYDLSEKWKTPAETLKSGTGDCEDVDFLFLSMIPHFGIDKAYLVVGMLDTGQSESPHTWVEVDGHVVDPTGLGKHVQKAEYNERKRFEVEY